MGSLDRLWNPITRDFTAAERGGFVVGDAIENKIIASYSIPLGSWEGDPTLGHRFDELARELDTASTRQRAHDFAIEAVQWLLDAGELESVEAFVESADVGRLAFEVAIRVSGENKPRTLGPFFIPVGV